VIGSDNAATDGYSYVPSRSSAVGPYQRTEYKESSINSGANFYKFHSLVKLNGVPLPFTAGVGIQLRYVRNLNTRREMGIRTLIDILQVGVCPGSVKV